jgi:glycosyltransferase involved in cell wall biosynthesis
LLLEAGHSVTILAGRGQTFDRRAPVQQIALLDSMHPQIREIGDQLAKGIISHAFHQTESAIRQELAARLHGVDILIAHNVLTLHKNLPLTTALWRLREVGVNIATIAWAYDLAWVNPQYIPALHDGAPWNYMTRPLPNAHYVVTSEERAAQLAAAWGAHSGVVHTIPVGIDTTSFLRLSPLTRRLTERWRLWEQDVVLLQPARITRRKNIELSIRVIASLVARGITAKLIVTGPPGPHNIANRGYVQELDDLRRSLGVEQAATLLYLERDGQGRPLRVSDRVVSELYTLSDALLFPSKQEGFGIPILEAGMARLPVFCSDIAPLRQLAGDAGRYFSTTASPDAIADLIEDWMHSDQEHLVKRKVLGGYSWSAIYAQHIEPLLRSAVEEQR